eukprot:180349-Prymnesium_polylepis.2
MRAGRGARDCTAPPLECVPPRTSLGWVVDGWWPLSSHALAPHQRSRATTFPTAHPCSRAAPPPPHPGPPSAAADLLRDDRTCAALPS